LNLASSPVENHRRFFAVALAVGVPALILVAVLWMRVVRDRAVTSVRRTEVERLQADMAALRAQRAELERFFADPATRLVTQQAGFLNGIIDQRSFPWTQFFLDLEHHLPGGVRILALTPSLSGEQVRVKMRVGALSDKSKLDFLKALEEGQQFSGLELVSETRPAKSSEEKDVVQLDLEADYHVVPPSQKGAQSGGAP
jgi:Tfp pilus assembly protein PilN